MMNNKIFISYSWSNPNHEEWVLNLAKRLVLDGVDVKIDKWDLKEGNDLYSFMEDMVKSDEISKVLLILDKKYSEKANDRNGGVGSETQIISPKIYTDISQEKFIPVIAEKDENNNPFIPTYLSGRVYVDLSNEEDFEDNYEKLLRNLFKRPLLQKPKLGNPPSYLFEETPNDFKTSIILRSLDNQIIKFPNRINSTLKEFLEDFLINLKKYKISFIDNTYINVGKQIIDNINEYILLRDDYVILLNKITKTNTVFDVEIFIKFLEDIIILKEPEEGISSYGSHEYENFKFFIHEIFLYTIAIPLKNEDYKFIEEIFYSGYFFKSRYNSRSESENFAKLYHNIDDTIRPFYDQTHSHKLSPMADVIIKNAHKDFNKYDIIKADLLCHHIARLENLRWFPITYVYDENGNDDFYKRLISSRHFEKVKGIFNVNTTEELKLRIIAFTEKNKDSSEFGYSNSWNRVNPINEIINIETLATKR